jgi:RimJ/RimL family protein N-acetyltransferase
MFDFADSEIRTERLLLRPLREGDLDRLASWQALPEASRFLPWEPATRGQVEPLLVRWIAATRLERDDDEVKLAVVRVEDGLLVGDVTLVLRSVEHSQAEIGCILHPDSGGRGYAAEAVRAIVDFAFDELGSHRVFARTDARNTPAINALRRLDFRQEAHLRHSEFFKGSWNDEVVFAVLAPEWRPSPT